MTVDRMFRRVRRIALKQRLVRQTVDYAERRARPVSEMPPESTWSDARRGVCGPERFESFMPDEELARLIELMRQYGATFEGLETAEIDQPGDFIYAMY